MEIAGYIAAAFIGLLLGMMGGGGSILTVPVLVYLFRIQPIYATSYSLFIVGFTSLTGAFENYIKGFVSVRTAVLFGASSSITVFVIRRWIIPAIPDIIIQTADFKITSAALTMALFALLMIISSIPMLRSQTHENHKSAGNKAPGAGKLLLYGMAIGIITGLLGAGGGFILIPALVILLHLPMKEAIGTSLLIIAINSLIGFAGDIGHFNIEWRKLLIVTTIAIGGIFTGLSLAEKIKATRLKKIFGWFVLAMGLFILTKEIIIQYWL